MISELTQKLQNKFEEYLYALHQHSLNVNILNKHSTIIKIKMLTLIEFICRAFSNFADCLASLHFLA